MKQLQMPAEDFEKLRQAVVWYDAMPAFLEVGDRFHENMSEKMDDLLPEVPEIESDEYYSIGVELTGDDRLILNLQNVVDYMDEIQVELIPE